MNRLLRLCALAGLSFTSLATAAEPALTIYNQEFAVVRETVPLDLKEGQSDLRFAGVTAQLEPDSVILRDPTGRTPLQILEQNYRNDPVNQALLLSFFEGQTIDFLKQEPQKPDQSIQGKVIRSGHVPGGEPIEPIIEVEGKMRFKLPGIPLFPALGNDTILKPTLSWKIQSPAAAKLNAELAYVTRGFTWEASYNIVAPDKGDQIDLVGWITMNNSSGTAFHDARIKLMAGDVNKIQPVQPLMERRMFKSDMAMAAAEPPVTEKSFDEFHLYTLANRTTLRDKETKQVEFVRSQGVNAARFYVYDGAAIGPWLPGRTVGGDPGYGVQGNKKVAVYREFKNSQDNRLGMALPAGRIRFYQQDADRQLEFVGENKIEHTPKDETLRLYVGDSFDLVGERKRTDFRVNNANNWADESFAITVRNHKKEPVEIRVVEHLYRWITWEVREKSHNFEKKDAQTIEFRVPLQPDEEKTVTYKVHYTW